jgi:competence protein F
MVLLSIFLDFLFPPRCPNCRAYVEQRGQFCPLCIGRLIGLHALVRTGDARVYLDGIWAFAHYQEGVRDLLRRLKYQCDRSVLSALHGILAEGAAVIPMLPHPLSAVPVPLAPERLHARGFNQTEEIFAPWLSEHGIRLSPLLMRTRHTAPLYERTRAERRHELRGAFAVAEDSDVRGKDFLLVDDIMTTGATLTECARVLKTAGAERIYAFVLASEHI